MADSDDQNITPAMSDEDSNLGSSSANATGTSTDDMYKAVFGNTPKSGKTIAEEIEGDEKAEHELGVDEADEKDFPE